MRWNNWKETSPSLQANRIPQMYLFCISVHTKEIKMRAGDNSKLC